MRWNVKNLTMMAEEGTEKGQDETGRRILQEMAADHCKEAEMDVWTDTVCVLFEDRRADPEQGWDAAESKEMLGIMPPQASPPPPCPCPGTSV
jgi:hypothetical protein